jgi:hypothetical protein
VNDGRSHAENVRVKVTRVRVERAGVVDEQPEHRRLRNLPLAWANSKVTNRHAEGEPRNIPRNDADEVDLVHVNEARPAELHLDTRPRLPGDPQWIEDRAVTVELSVAVDGGPTRLYEVAVELEEPWTDTSALAALRVTGPRPVRARRR